MPTGVSLIELSGIMYGRTGRLTVSLLAGSVSKLKAQLRQTKRLLARVRATLFKLCQCLLTSCTARRTT